MEIRKLRAYKYGAKDLDEVDLIGFMMWLRHSQHLPDHFLRMAWKHVDDFDDIKDEWDRLNIHLLKLLERDSPTRFV